MNNTCVDLASSIVTNKDIYLRCSLRTVFVVKDYKETILLRTILKWQMIFLEWERSEFWDFSSAVVHCDKLSKESPVWKALSAFLSQNYLQILVLRPIQILLSSFGSLASDELSLEQEVSFPATGFSIYYIIWMFITVLQTTIFWNCAYAQPLTRHSQIVFDLLVII